ncbi:hypothetical protein MAR_032166, partial [Mya arenaria]
MKAYNIYLLFIFRLCNGEAAIDCSGRCACCIDGELGCKRSPSIHVDTICFKGCIDTIYGFRCKNPCRGNCLICSQDTGAECFACKPGFYGTSSFCAESCPIRCIDGTCDNDGRCTCIPNFKERRINTASSTNIATAALVGVFATLFMCTAAVFYLWNRRRSKPIEQSSEIQLDQIETEKAYEQLQRQASEPTYRN